MNSAMMKAAAPMIGGMSWPLVDAATSMAPAFVAGMPIRRMTGMVKVPVVTTLAIEEPENHAGHAGRQDRRLGRPAAEAPHHGEGEREEVLARARLVEERAEQHEEEDEADRDADGDTEDGLAREPLVADQPGSG